MTAKPGGRTRRWNDRRAEAFTEVHRRDVILLRLEARPLRVGDRVRFTEGPKETYVVSGIVHRQDPDWYRLEGYPQDVPRHKLRKVAGKASA